MPRRLETRTEMLKHVLSVFEFRQMPPSNRHPGWQAPDYTPEQEIGLEVKFFQEQMEKIVAQNQEYSNILNKQQQQYDSLDDWYKRDVSGQQIAQKIEAYRLAIEENQQVYVRYQQELEKAQQKLEQLQNPSNEPEIVPDPEPSQKPNITAPAEPSEAQEEVARTRQRQMESPQSEESISRGFLGALDRIREIEGGEQIADQLLSLLKRDMDLINSGSILAPEDANLWENINSDAENIAESVLEDPTIWEVAEEQGVDEFPENTSAIRALKRIISEQSQMRQVDRLRLERQKRREELQEDLDDSSEDDPALDVTEDKEKPETRRLYENERQKELIQRTKKPGFVNLREVSDDEFSEGRSDPEYVAYTEEMLNQKGTPTSMRSYKNFVDSYAKSYPKGEEIPSYDKWFATIKIKPYYDWQAEKDPDFQDWARREIELAERLKLQERNNPDNELGLTDREKQILQTNLNWENFQRYKEKIESGDEDEASGAGTHEPREKSTAAPLPVQSEIEESIASKLGPKVLEEDPEGVKNLIEKVYLGAMENHAADMIQNDPYIKKHIKSMASRARRFLAGVFEDSPEIDMAVQAFENIQRKNDNPENASSWTGRERDIKAAPSIYEHPIVVESEDNDPGSSRRLEPPAIREIAEDTGVPEARVERILASGRFNPRKQDTGRRLNADQQLEEEFKRWVVERSWEAQKNIINKRLTSEMNDKDRARHDQLSQQIRALQIRLKSDDISPEKRRQIKDSLSSAKRKRNEIVQKYQVSFAESLSQLDDSTYEDIMMAYMLGEDSASPEYDSGTSMFPASEYSGDEEPQRRENAPLMDISAQFHNTARQIASAQPELGRIYDLLYNPNSPFFMGFDDGVFDSDGRVNWELVQPKYIQYFGDEGSPVQALKSMNAAFKKRMRETQNRRMLSDEEASEDERMRQQEGQGSPTEPRSDQSPEQVSQSPTTRDRNRDRNEALNVLENMGAV